MSNLKQTLEGIEVHCRCPFEEGKEKIIDLKELLKIAGYLLTAAEVSCVEKALESKKQSAHINADEKMLLEQAHEEVKSYYSHVASDVGKSVDYSGLEMRTPSRVAE